MFAVTIWWEPREDASLPPVWRGSVVSERTRQRVYFSDLQTLSQFLRESAGLPAPSRWHFWRGLGARWRK